MPEAKIFQTGLALSMKLEKHLDVLLQEQAKFSTGRGVRTSMQSSAAHGTPNNEPYATENQPLAPSVPGTPSLPSAHPAYIGLQQQQQQQPLISSPYLPPPTPNSNSNSNSNPSPSPYDDLPLEERALALAIEETWVASGRRWRPWAANGRNIRIGEYILLVDSDTVVPEDCLRDAAREMGEKAGEMVAIIQHESGELPFLPSQLLAPNY